MPKTTTTTQERERTEVTTYEEIGFTGKEVAKAVAEKYELDGYDFHAVRSFGLLFSSADEVMIVARKETDKEIQ